MSVVEGAVLATPGYASHCTLNYANGDGDGRCRSPLSVLTFLHVNDTAHEVECREGYCWTPYWSSQCGGGGVPWGQPPCISTVFDWRNGVLAPVDGWPAILSDVLVFQESFLPPSATLRVMLGELLNATATAVDLSSLYARARFDISTGELYDSQYTVALWSSLEEAVKGGVSKLQQTPSMRSTPAVSGSEINVFWMSWEPVNLLTNVYLDMLLALASLAFIFFYIWFNVSSFILACAALFEILMSIPLALTVWRALLGQKNFDFLQLVMIFLILCIGADDVFVFMDTWRASATMHENISGSLESRFAWTWSKAAGTMFATTLTTCICLGLTAISTIPTVRSFGLFGAFLVLVDYLQVITWFPAVVLWHEQHVCCRKRREEGVRQPQRLARLLRDSAAPRLHRIRYGSVLLALGLGVAGFAARATLFEPVESIPLFQETHWWETRQRLASEEFFSATSGDDDKVHAGIIYGLEQAQPVTYSATSQLLPDRDDRNVEKTVWYSAGFEATPAVQNEIVATCDAALADANLVEGAEVHCLLRDLKAHVGASFPYATEAALRVAIDSFANETGWDSWGRSGYVPDWDGDGIRALYNSFVTTLSRRQVTGSSIFGGDPRQTNPIVARWDSFTSQHCVETPCFATLYDVSGAIGFGALLSSLSQFANQTLYICVGACFLVLVAVTLNVIVALYATITVGLVIGSVMGLIIAIGMKDGMYENVFTILVVGMAIDYAVHLSHFYIHATGTRYEKARSAMYEVGASVIGGAITTVGAGIPLFACSVMFFFTQGVFIFFTALSALFFSFFFLVPLLMIAGPEATQGDLSALWRKVKASSAQSV